MDVRPRSAYVATQNYENYLIDIFSWYRVWGVSQGVGYLGGGESPRVDEECVLGYLGE